MSQNDNFIPDHYLDLSTEIENSISKNQDIPASKIDFAWQRSAISRAYYAAFLTLREQFLSNSNLRSLIQGRGHDHEAIKIKLYSLPSQFIYLANYFEELRDDRNNSDYKLPTSYQVQLSHVQLAIAKAKDIITNSTTIMTNL